jgi:hypothetical protein
MAPENITSQILALLDSTRGVKLEGFTAGTKLELPHAQPNPTFWL